MLVKLLGLIALPENPLIFMTYDVYLSNHVFFHYRPDRNVKIIRNTFLEDSD